MSMRTRPASPEVAAEVLRIIERVPRSAVLGSTFAGDAHAAIAKLLGPYEVRDIEPRERGFSAKRAVALKASADGFRVEVAFLW